MAVGGGLGALLVAFLGGDPRGLLEQAAAPSAAQPAAGAAKANPEEEPLRKFVSVVSADTEDVWNKLFQQQFGGKYREPKLVLFSGEVNDVGLAPMATYAAGFCSLGKFSNEGNLN
jgi:predicted metalloprotease